MAFVEYCLAVPANRWGQRGLLSGSAQDYPRAHHRRYFLLATWNHVIGFAMITIGAFFVFRGPL